MADPAQSHGRGPQNFPSSNVRSPLSAGTGSSGTPISFQTNVNRSKTKRWVEAKQYSYDGGDWGDDDDDDDDEEEEPAAVPRPFYATHHTGSSSELVSRRLSALPFGADEQVSVNKGRSVSGGDQKPLAFVRPADLYKRMREEKATHQSPIADPKDLKPDGAGTPSQTDQQTPSMGLPEVERMSSFGADFLDGADPNIPKETSAPQDASLHHKPSAGFRSVVHQAFDVPETPQSTTTSVARSNSDGTSTISPIMGGRSMTDERTPTIFEEPNESSPKVGATAGPMFNPGHRRDLSLPNSDNSPSRKPQVTDQDTPPADCAELSSIPPQNLFPESPDAGISPQNSSMQSYSSSGQDLPAPLKFGSTLGPDGFPGEIPTIRGPEESPQHADNDRLREEIIRSLSREATPAENPEQSHQPQSQAPTESIPHQFEKYWDGQTGPGPNEQPKALVSESHPDWSSPHPLAPKDPYSNSPSLTGDSSSNIVDQPKKPKLERRFSWESSDEEEPAPQKPGSYASPLPLDASLSMQEPEPITEEIVPLPSEALPESITSDNEGSDTQNAVRKPRLSIVPPLPENNTPPEQIMGPGTVSPKQPKAPPHVEPISLDESQLLGFRDILGITSVNQRIKSFEHTRDQFATLDTGLNNWLQFVVHEHPEHAGVVQQSQSLSPTVPSSPTRSRFPKLGSLGNLGSSNDGTPAGASHVRRPSTHLATVMNREKVGEKGKEFLHTAGAFSGKASGAAKGLFAKGRSKFRASGDKGQSAPSASSAPRHSIQFSIPSGAAGMSGNSSSMRNSVNLGSLPIFKSGRAEASSDPDPTGASLRLDGARENNPQNRINGVSSRDFLSRKRVGETGVQPKELPSPPAVPPKTQVARSPGLAGDLAQEMIAALGLSPTDPRPQRSASTPMKLNGPGQVNGGKRQFAESSEQSGEHTTGDQPASKLPARKSLVAEKSLPVVRHEPFDVPLPILNSQRHQPSKNIPEIITPSIRPVLDESTKPPSPPPKDNNGLAPDEGHNRQPSVSTLGADEQTGLGFDDDADREPPSPLQETINEVASDIEHTEHKSKAERPMNDNHALSADPSSGSLPSVQQKRKSFMPFYPSESPSSAEVLESKRRSISGLPPSAPNLHSPLRNEVRNVPGTRSSMLSFGSFSKHSSNKGSRPVTPANGLSQASESESPAQIEKSTIRKIKNFGKQRRASVGDLFSKVQVQGSQEAPARQRKRSFSRFSILFGRQDSQDRENNSPDHTRPTSEPLNRTLATPPATDGNSTKAITAAQVELPALDHPFEQQPWPIRLPEPTAPPSLTPSYTRSSSAHIPQHASISHPPSSSFNHMAMGGRFYSQFRSPSMNETPTGSHYGGALSLPLPGHSRTPSPMSVHENRVPQPLSPLQELQDQQIHQLREDEQHKQETKQTELQDPQLGTLSENQEQEEHEELNDRVLGEHLRHELPGEPTDTQKNEHDYAQDRYEVPGSKSQQSLSPQPNVGSRTPASPASATSSSENHTNAIADSNSSVVSSHPHRSESKACVVHDPPRPAELAITADNSSEEIIMSPTSYPGQEWTPICY
ncbi:hypothetical protein N7457_005547 [Penicillium paradoxum]|uniref:uncharacterized protein n=1 Tax=Penicillium paradoxum TaxID=176176 RepID=UPI002547196D|nr:uncharacterized protein N7457_005547 [Penicillium paradoxum]KAJ5780387.1 hypothetical protein N7457_005547 [Penicillium paradoxum]